MNLQVKRASDDEEQEGFYRFLVDKPSVPTVMPPPRRPMEILTREEILRRRTAAPDVRVAAPVFASSPPVEMHADDLKMMPKKRGGWPKGRRRK